MKTTTTTLLLNLLLLQLLLCRPSLAWTTTTTKRPDARIRPCRTSSSFGPNGHKGHRPTTTTSMGHESSLSSSRTLLFYSKENKIHATDSAEQGSSYYHYQPRRRRPLQADSALWMTAKGDDDTGNEKPKRSIAYRALRIASYPVRKVYRWWVPKPTSGGDDTVINTDDDNDDDDEALQEEIQEIIDSTVSLAKSTVETAQTAARDAQTTVLTTLDEAGKTLDQATTAASENLNSTAAALQSTLTEATTKLDEATALASENLNSALQDTLGEATKTLDEATAQAALTLKQALQSQSQRSSTSTIDLSGDWTLLVTDDFKEAYDQYLTLLGQPFFVRSVALSIVALTTEQTRQSENGRSLWIKGQNLRGTWERTLYTSHEDDDNKDNPPVAAEIVTADGERVECEAWWENGGQLHRSWLKGVEKYGGGSFESKRYLERSNSDNDSNDQDLLVCESIFHPNDPEREKAAVTWRFRRAAAAAVAGVE